VTLAKRRGEKRNLARPFQMQAMYDQELPYPRRRGFPLGCIIRETVSASDTPSRGQGAQKIKLEALITRRDRFRLDLRYYSTPTAQYGCLLIR
jgi:hypothetical protein